MTADEKLKDDLPTLAKRLLDIESAQRSGSLRKLFSNKVSLDGKELDREVAAARLHERDKANADQTAIYDTCKVASSTDDCVVVDCSVLLQSPGKVARITQRIALTGPSGLVTYLGDPAAMKSREKKQRVKAFLSSE
jgi:hypothetical protein